MSDIVIHARGLTKTYGGARLAHHHRLSDLFNTERRDPPVFLALDDVSFDLGRGEILGLVGGNGAGKSTLLKILSRVVRPTAGEALIRGRLASLLEVGTGFHPELTGRENIYMSGIILGMTRSEVSRHFDEIVAFSGTEQFIDLPMKRLSSGMQTRLGFAVAAHLEADILFVDEVLAVGDAEFQKKCLGKMKEVATGGRTVLFVSHNMISIQTLCSKAMWLDRGRLRSLSADVRHVTLEYLSGGSGAAKAEWINEARDETESLVVLRALRLRTPSGAIVSGPVSNSMELTLEVEAEIRKLNPALMIGYGLSTTDGDVLWCSFHTDRGQSEWPPLRAGRVRLTTKLPPRTLNEGSYRVEFLSCIYSHEWFHPPTGGGPSVSFEIQGELSDSPLWMTRRDGRLAPNFAWTCDVPPAR